MKMLSYHLRILFLSFSILLCSGGLFNLPFALADQCAAQCYAQENACRKATNDDPKCGVELTKCLQSCRGK